jgi:hypothetical protein
MKALHRGRGDFKKFQLFLKSINGNNFSSQARKKKNIN